jgi:hypothetical protein
MKPQTIDPRAQDMAFYTQSRRLGCLAAGLFLFASLSSSANSQGEPAHGEPATKASARSQAAPDAGLEQARKTYRATEWPRGVRYQGFVLGQFALPGLTGREPECLPPAPVQRHYGDDQGRDRVRIEYYLEDTAAQAHERLLGWLATRSNTDPAPTAASQGVIVGDVGYAGRSGTGAGRFARLAFTRGNLAFRVLDLAPATTPPLDLGSIALALDAASQKAAPLAATATVPARPRIARFAPARSRCLAGEVVPVDLEIEDPASGRPLVQWIVGGLDQGQGYLQQDAGGRWQLHTTGKGPLVLTVCVVASTGSVASRSCELVID